MNGIDMQRSQDRFCNMLTCDLGAFQLRDLSKAMENPPSMELLMGTSSNRYGTLWDFSDFQLLCLITVRVSHKKKIPLISHEHPIFLSTKQSSQDYPEGLSCRI